jgi:peptidoglycan/xylan/chitin deacetylase (PgdA/CDA1 family)
VNRLPILTFHSIDTSGSVVSIPPPFFARMMEDLAAAGWRGCTVSEALARWQTDGASLKLFGLSFDDGYHNLLENALPVLDRLDFAASVFVIAGRCGDDSRWPGQASWVPTMQLLDWPDLETLMAAGWEIGSHGWSHAPLTEVDAQRVEKDVEESKTLLESNLAVQVPIFAYPYGAHNETVRRIVRDYHDAACGVRLALATRADVSEGFELPRIDAHYLRRFPASTAIGSPLGAAYLAARRWAASLRRPPWKS